MEKIYGNRSARELDRAGGYFQRHMEHMTSENLNSKGDIALELAHRDLEFAALLTRHNALVEAVAWERECEGVAHWRYEVWEMAEVGSGDCEIYTVAQCIRDEARAEVDRLLSGDK